MRVKQPEPFDREREYKPGERAIVNGTVLIATLWTPAAQRLADSSETLFCQRCVRCKIGKDICTGAICQFFFRFRPSFSYYNHTPVNASFAGVVLSVWVERFGLLNSHSLPASFT